MTEITQTDADHWTTTEKVRDDVKIQVQNQEPDHEKRIERATRRVRAWYQDASGQEPPDQPPDMLDDATSLLAASLVHQAFSQNITGDNDGDQRHVFLEDAAQDTFEDWKKQAELDPGDDTAGESSEQVTGMSGTISGTSPIQRDRY